MSKKPTPKLRLYVWEGVLQDYTPGMAVALATSPAHARQLFRKKMDGGLPSDLQLKPLTVTKPAAFYVYGGG